MIHAVTNSTLEIAKSSDQEAWGPAALAKRRERAREHLARLAEKREHWVEQNRRTAWTASIPC
jgi:hypothetical protein